MSLVSAVPARKERRTADKRTTKSTSRPSSAHGVVGTSVPAPVPVLQEAQIGFPRVGPVP